MSDWGPPCRECGHPSTYHGVSFCMVDAGSATKRRCDCAGYNVGRLLVNWLAVADHLRTHGIDPGECLDDLTKR